MLRTNSLGAAIVPRPGLKTWVLFGALVGILLSYIVFLMLDPATAQALAREGALIENLGAASFIIASYLFVLCYFRSAGSANRFLGRETKGNIWFLALALLMFVCFGEEISWGQRIFGWETPAAFKEMNAQNETNVHNLWLFQATTPDGTAKSSLQLLLNANRLFSIFWLVYCVLVPLLVSWSDIVTRSMAFLGVPIPALAVGSLFVANYVVFRTIVAFGEIDRNTLSAFDELKETNYAFAFIVLGFWFLYRLPAPFQRTAGRPGSKSA